ncbi:MAG: acyl-CoA thioesterase [Chlorobiales bacterium]|nr:acyl-CoA thioesterase [Chlorobiales bacterium]
MLETRKTEKTVSESRIEATYVVTPPDVNYLGNLAGGTLMHWMDLSAAIVGGRHANSVVVTASVDSLEFRQPIKLGEIVIIKASVNRAFKSSMEIGVKVLSENVITGEQKVCNRAYFTFVAIDENLRPIKVPEIIPESEDEKRRYEKAEVRRQIRLLNRGEI